MTQIKILAVSALLLGSISTAFADPDGFDVDINRPAIAQSAPTQSAPVSLNRRAPAVQASSTGAGNWMDRASQNY